MYRWVTQPKQVTSPTWGFPPPCKQALRYIWQYILGQKLQVESQRRCCFPSENACTQRNNNCSFACRHFIFLFIAPSAEDSHHSNKPWKLSRRCISLPRPPKSRGQSSHIYKPRSLQTPYYKKGMFLLHSNNCQNVQKQIIHS